MMRWLARGATVILVFTYGWWAVSRPPFSALATIAIVVPGGVAVVLGSLRRLPLRRRDGVRGAAWWAGLTAVAMCWQLGAYLQQPRADHPTLSSLMNAVLDGQPVRTAGFALWLLAAAALARR